jgi:hypothetical protein
MEPVPLVFATGWTSGVNAYLTVLVMGLLGRFASVSAVPDELQHNNVLIAVAVMFSIEFVADKIPGVDSAWDSIHTAIRPAVGAVIGLLVAGEAYDMDEATGAILGATTAFLSHAVKAGVRLGANLSPEPFSNISLSFAEDGVVVAVVGLALAEPWIAAAVALFLLIWGLWAVLVAARLIRGARRRWPFR